VCPLAHFHFALKCEPAVTVVAFHPTASRESFGCVVFRSLNPRSTLRPEQYGQPSPRVRSLGGACHLWPSLHRHSRLLSDFGGTNEGFQPSASAAISGNFVARSLNPARVLFPEQYGQPRPATRLFTVARHSCPCLHLHSASFVEPRVTVRRSRSTASCARYGKDSATEGLVTLGIAKENLSSRCIYLRAAELHP
jgi:hypothetical protein